MAMFVDAASRAVSTEALALFRSFQRKHGRRKRRCDAHLGKQLLFLLHADEVRNVESSRGDLLDSDILQACWQCHCERQDLRLHGVAQWVVPTGRNLRRNVEEPVMALVLCLLPTICDASRNQVSVGNASSISKVLQSAYLQRHSCPLCGS